MTMVEAFLKTPLLQMQQHGSSKRQNSGLESIVGRLVITWNFSNKFDYNFFFRKHNCGLLSYFKINK